MTPTGLLVALMAGTLGLGLIVNLGRRVVGLFIAPGPPPQPVSWEPHPAPPPRATPQDDARALEKRAQRARSRRFGEVRASIEARGHRAGLIDLDSGEVIELSDHRRGE